MSLRIDILTLFPGLFVPFLQTSIPGRAASKGLVGYHLTDIRDFAAGTHRSVDDKPCGGGPGMVLMPQVVFAAAEAAIAMDPTPPKVIVLSPQGRVLNHRLVTELAAEPRLLLIAGRYEGFDERIPMGLGATELSVGDYVLSGGELAAMIVIDAVVRQIPGVLGAADGPADESFADGLLEHPQYTWPREFRGMLVPDVLLSGNHRRITQWRLAQRQERTRIRRPDLWQAYLERRREANPNEPGLGGPGREQEP